MTFQSIYWSYKRALTPKLFLFLVSESGATCPVHLTILDFSTLALLGSSTLFTFSVLTMLARLTC